MRALFLRATPPLLFGSGGTKGGVHKVTAAKIDYADWYLSENTRNILAPIHHPLVTEYFIRLSQRATELDKWQETLGEKGVATPLNQDGTPIDYIQWNIQYRGEVDLAHHMCGLLTSLNENVELESQTQQKPPPLSDGDKELLEMVAEDIKSITGDICSLDGEVDKVMNQRLASEDVIGSSSRTWNVSVAGRAGGEEAGLFAAELADMFKAYATGVRGLKVRRLDESEEEAADATVGTASSGNLFQVSGENVYRYFHHEIGVHKVQRVPVTDAVGKMQTSTAVVTMMPVLDPVSVNVHEEDCTIDFVRGSGPGGQGMQSSSNCVVLTHRPSGISVKCHQSRSALGNKELALQMVAQQILAARIKDQNSSLHDAWRNQWSSGERSDKMRTYNFPQNRVTDHRLGKDYPLSSFMDRGSGLVGLHDELNDLSDRQEINSVLLKYIKGRFGSTL